MAKAETATLTYSALYSSDTEVTAATHDVSNTTDGTIATVSYEKGSATAPKYFKNGTSVRLYAEKNTGKGNSIIIKPESGVTITAIAFEYSQNKFNSGMQSIGSIDNNGDWSGSVTGTETVKLTNTNTTSTQIRIQSVTITYTKEVAGPKDYEQTFADMTLEVGESKVIDLGEEHPETFVIDAEDAAIAEVVEAEGVFTITGKAVGTTKVSVMWEGEGWNGGETEFNVTVNPVLPAPELSFDKAEITEYIGSLEQDLPVLTATEGLKITYSSSNEAAATVNPETGAVSLVAAGTTTITATSEATAEYKAGEASYILNVKTAPTGGYALLTNIDDLVDGTVGVIVAKTDADNNLGKGMGSFSNKGFTLADVTFEGNNVNITDGVTEFTFNKNGESYNIVSGESYLGVASSSKTDLTFGSKATATSDIANQNAAISLDDNANASIVFANSSNRQIVCRLGNTETTKTFKFYDKSNINGTEYNNVQIYVAQPAAEVVAPNMVVDGEENAEPVIVFHEGMTIHFNIPEGVRVYRRFVATEEPATPAPARVTGEDGNEYERHTEAYTVPGYGTLSYFAESQGVRSAVKEVRVSDTTGVEDITVGAEEGEAVYYDMTGRRVANPTAGLYIRVNGSTATKVYLR